MKTLALCAALLAGNSFLAADCGTSKQFGLDGSQRISGILKDPSGSPIPGLVVELLNGKTVVRQFRTDNNGKLDLAQLPSGKYRLRIISQPLCAPKIDCGTNLCTVNGTLRINERKAKPIIVY